MSLSRDWIFRCESGYWIFCRNFGSVREQPFLSLPTILCRINSGRIAAWSWNKENSMHRKSAGIGHAYQFRSADSAMHRLPSGWKLTLWFLLSISAIIARDPWALSGLLVLNGATYYLSRLKLVDFWQDIRFFFFQML